MELTKQEREYRNLTAESFAGLSIGLWTVSLIGYLTSGVTGATYFLAVVGAISVLISIYLMLPWNLGQKSALKFLETNKIMSIVKLLVWLIVILAFGVNLIQTKIIWLIIAGLITMILAFIVFYVVLFRTSKDKRKEKLT